MDKLRTVLAVLTLTTLLLGYVAPALAQTSVMPLGRSDKDMMAAMMETKDISIAASTMKTAGLEGMMMPGETYTLFVASDMALNATSPDMRNAMKEKLNDRQVAREFVNGHMIAGMVMPDEMTDGKTLTLRNGMTMKVTRADGKMMVDDANIIKAVETNNGIVYVMDKIPSSIKTMIVQMGMLPRSTMPDTG